MSKTFVDIINDLKEKIDTEIEEINVSLAEGCSKDKKEEVEEEEVIGDEVIEEPIDKIVGDVEEIDADELEGTEVAGDVVEYPENITEGSKAEYEKFFNAKLEKFGVKSPAELDDSKKKEFFNEIEKEWDKEDD